MTPTLHKTLRNDIFKILTSSGLSNTTIRHNILSIIRKFVPRDEIKRVVFNIKWNEDSGRYSPKLHNFFTALLFCGVVLPHNCLSGVYNLSFNGKMYHYDSKNRAIDITLI